MLLLKKWSGAPEEYWIRYQILYYIKDYDNGQGIKKGDLPANWKDDNVIVKHHPNNENTEAEKLKSKEVLPAHTNARKDEIRLFPKYSLKLREYLTIQITRVLTLSSTIRVVADSSLVTLIPAKLKKAMEMMVPEKARASRGLWANW